MKITDVKIIRISGHIDRKWSSSEERVARPLDIYPEFRDDGPSGKLDDTDRTVAIHAMYVEIATDEGFSGFYGPLLSPQAYVIYSELRRFLIGRDPLCGVMLWDQMSRMDRHARAGHMMMAISAVDCALWDLRGKYFQAPVYRLLGGPTRERIKAYGSTLGHSLEPDLASKRAREFYEMGFTAQKWFFRHGPGAGYEGKEKNLKLVRTLRETLGDEAELMFDCWMGWDLQYAISMANDMMPYKPTWLEEPLPPNRLEGFIKLKRTTGIPLAAGEHLYTRWDVKPFLEAGAIDFLQADPDWTGGITELVKICALAAIYEIKVVPHGHNIVPAVHVIASQSPSICPLMEYLIRFQGRQQFFHKFPWKPVNGHMQLPTEPGLGIDFDESRIEDRRELEWDA